jgi:tetratricopeptide (TPR) repeat protein
MALEGERLREVCKFFEESFRSPELYQFLVVNQYQAVAAAVNRSVGDKPYVFDVVQALDQRGLITAELFTHLAEEFPAKRAEITRLADFCLNPGGPTKPHNLPLTSIGKLFKGREPFLDELRKGLTTSDGRAWVVHGLGGVGKTRAALEYAWRYAAEYTALLFVSASTPAELRAHLASLVGVLGTTAETASVDRQLAAVLRWLDAHPGWLLIVDNVDTEEAAAAVEGLLDQLRTGHVLITARIGNWSAGVEPLELDVLAPADAAAFLLERTRNRRKGADDATRAAAIAGELDGLALALEQAGAYIDKQRLSLAEYLQRWEARRPEVLGWHDPRLMKYPASVAVTWETTFTQLAEPERRLLEVLSWLVPEPIPLFFFDAAALEAAVAGPRDTLLRRFRRWLNKQLQRATAAPREALAGLAGYSLARLTASGEAVLVHRLVQEITRGRIPKGDRTARLQLALDAVNDLAPDEAQDVRTWAVWTPLAAHAAAVSRSADAAGLAEPTSRLMDLLASYWRTRGQFRAAEPLYRRALAIDEQSYGPDHPDVARDLNNLAELLQATNRLEGAEPLYHRALAIDEQSYGPDHPNATTLNNLAVLLRDTNRLEEAEPLLRRALAIAEQSLGPDHPNIAAALNNLAGLLRDTNRPGEAEPLYHHALAIWEQSYGPDHPNVASALNNLAGLLYATNRHSEAEPLLRRSVQVLIEFQRRTGHEHPNFGVAVANYVALLQALGKTPEQIGQQLHELIRQPRSEGP